jgi:transcriptional regulator with XRE-family HTH domain
MAMASDQHVSTTQTHVASAEQRRGFGAAVFAARKAAGLRQEDLAARLFGADQARKSQPTVSFWESGTHEPEAEMVFAIERAIGVDPGSLSRHLGYVPADIDPASIALDVLTSIQNDPLLSREARRRLVTLYRTELETGASSV